MAHQASGFYLPFCVSSKTKNTCPSMIIVHFVMPPICTAGCEHNSYGQKMRMNRLVKPSPCLHQKPTSGTRAANWNTSPHVPRQSPHLYLKATSGPQTHICLQPTSGEKTTIYIIKWCLHHKSTFGS